MMQSGQDSCGDDGPPATINGFLRKKSEIKLDGILGTRRRMLIEHEISSLRMSATIRRQRVLRSRSLKKPNRVKHRPSRSVSLSATFVTGCSCLSAQSRFDFRACQAY